MTAWEPLTKDDFIHYEIGGTTHLVTVRSETIRHINYTIETLLSEKIEYDRTHEPSQQLWWLISGAQLARDHMSHLGT